MRKERRKTRPGMTQEQTGAVRGIRLHSVNTAMVTLVILVAVVLLVTVDHLTETYHELRSSTQVYVTCQNAARDMIDASNYLTEQARGFAATGDRKYLTGYFNEYDVVKRRESALESVEKNMPDTEALSYLEHAKRESDDLIEMEFYSMRLVVEAKDYDPEEYPRQIRDTELLSRDKKLSSDEQMLRAQEFLFNETYQTKKNMIAVSVQSGLRQVLEASQQAQGNSSLAMEDTLQRVNILIGGMMFLFIIMVSALVWLIIRPLENSIDFINSKQHLPMKGAFELRYMAASYNRMYDELEQQRDQLAYEAIHDGMTGAFNRAGFEERFQEADHDSITLILLDVDHFKEINDTHGHSVGDLILQQVVRLIQSNFRQEDYICRIGGDEFAVIMLYTDSSLRSVVRQKFDQINDQLKHPAGTLPPVSLSAGVAFCDRPGPTENMYRDADEALYTVKRSERGGIHFYGDSE